jgi:hypothetical protein
MIYVLIFKKPIINLMMKLKFLKKITTKFIGEYYYDSWEELKIEVDLLLNMFIEN